jgi:hypothetical protein
MNKVFCFGLVLMAASAVARADDGKLIADFNAPAPNNLGGNFGSFGPEGEDGNACKASVDEQDRHGKDGSSLRLDYNVSKKGSFNGFWMKLGPGDAGNNFDASGFTKLSLWIKGDEKSGIPTRVKVEVKGDAGPVAKKYVGDLKGKWTKIEIPLQELAKQGVDLSKLNEFCVVFEQAQTGPSTVGAINIDDVVLEK